MRLRTVTVRRITTQIVSFETFDDARALDRGRKLLDAGGGGVSEVDEIISVTDLPLDETYPGIDDETGRFSLPGDL